MQCVVDQVGEHSLDLSGVDLDRWSVGPDLDPYAGSVRAEPGERLPDELVHGPELAVWLDGTGLEPREVEELAHDPVEAGSLVADRLGKSQSIVGLQR